MSAPVVDLAVRVRSGERAVALAAAAPVRHVTAGFLDALNCRGAWAQPGDDAGARRGLRAV